MMDCKFVEDCKALKVGERLHKPDLSFEELFNLKYPEDPDEMMLFHKFEITAMLTKPVVMNVWNGTHPPEKNTRKHTAPKGTKVRVWMVSRFGDVGITDRLEDAHGYDTRIDQGLLVSWTITKTHE